MEKRIIEELINHESIKEKFKIDTNYYYYRPDLRFITEKVCIHSINDTIYPNYKDENEKSFSWFITFFYDTYYRGLEFCLDSLSTFIIMDKDGFWEPIGYEDKRRNNPKYKTYNAKEIGRIPYSNIIDFNKDGDEYYVEPHLYCDFNKNGLPFEEIYYKSFGNPEEHTLDYEFDKEMQTIFPKE